MEYTAFALLFLGLILLGSSATLSRREQARTAARLTSIETKLDAVVAHLGAVVPEPSYPEVEALIRAGRTVEAIRQYREETGADLLTAKNAVDAISARLRL
ncbi:hypothetical protein [Actinoplanes sp. N902-109]|uniref:hypothetical protein n=1 Tax=Actinoplanes sp. (strain N902-109) TaxID=649831 RepID=UPI00032948A7|nr:hypothetical protein [Actinoplanes sp. N902-109]AGL19892.1 hypothetical protein L083_6382 [Actinoplanes sp. N902-109]